MTEEAGTTAELPGSATPGVSPYATGGGGVSFERRAAVTYLARLLTGATAPELDGRRVERVSFQQAPAHQVDDVVVVAVRDDGTDHLELSIAMRRSPAFTTSDQDTEKLFGDLLTDLRAPATAGPDSRLAICVAGPQPAAQQVAELAALARSQATAQGFHDLVGTPKKFRRVIVDRLGHLVNLVAANLATETSTSDVETMTWRLLNHLDVLMPRLEAADESDWADLLNQLESWARVPTVGAAVALRDRLQSRAAVYAPAAADVDLAMLRRDAHDALHLERRRREVAWTELRRLDTDARNGVRSSLGLDANGGALRLSRPGPAAAVLRELNPGPAVLVTGESGVGKSALVLGELSAAAAADPAAVDVVFLNLRRLPETVVGLRHVLGVPLEDLLVEMSAPTRILVLDGTDVVAERDDHILGDLLRASLSAGVTPWAITATDGRAAVRALLETVVGEVRELTVGGFEDAELDDIATAFPQLRRLVDEPHAKELLRRPAVVDLFVRSGSSGLPLSDAEALDIVWSGLVRANELRTRGLPDARDQVMLQLAAQQLRQTNPLTLTSLEPAAISGLVHDVLLRPATGWETLPTFAHDLVRTYATARILLASGDPVAELEECGAPRWALPAARLAIQAQLAAPAGGHSSPTGQLVLVQAASDRLREGGHGDRWADLPTEALLTLPNAGELLADSWPQLVADDAAGLQRVLRVVQQRHGRTGTLNRLVAEPVVALLLEHGWPGPLHKEVHELLTGWLRGLVLVGEPPGHPLRITLRARLVARVATGDQHLADAQRKNEERLAARSAEEVAADEARNMELEALTSFSGGEGLRRRRAWRVIPAELTDEPFLEELTLLGADLGDEGEALLRRVAADAPQRLAPALEEAFTGHALASRSVALLIDLIEAYYIDERDDNFGGLGDNGIRRHHGFSYGPMAAVYRGPFLALVRADLRGGVACLNRLLNHAATARVEMLRRPSWGATPEPDDEYTVDLDITGERRRYVGDSHVWSWYRGTSVGPYPCMSALLALELVCDEYLKAGVPLGRLVPMLLEGCENLAMPALVLGMLVRHLEDVGTELDPFLTEPEIWHLEFARTTSEYSSLAAVADGIVAPERRRWDLREVSTRLALAAAGERSDTLRDLGKRLIARAMELEGSDDASPMSEQMAAVHGWAASLDIDSYTFTETDDGVLVEQVVQEKVLARLAASNADLARGREATRILMRYPERYDQHAQHHEVTLPELLADLVVARELAEDPPAAGPLGLQDGPAAVAAATLEARFAAELDVPPDDVAWAAALLVDLINKFADGGLSDHDYSLFGQRSDHAAARALPLLALPAAVELRNRLAADGVDAEQITRAVSWIVKHGSNEARLFLARGFDPLWSTPCDTTGIACHHMAALAVIEDTARDCLVGPWDHEQQRSVHVHLEGPVSPQLHAAADAERIDVPRLSAVIRGSGAAASSTACCRTDAATLLTAALAAHRRGMRASEHGYHHSANDAAAAARAVLNVAAIGDSAPLFVHLNGYADDPRLLSEFLQALAAVGEETQARADAAREAWPSVLDRVSELVSSGVCASEHRYGVAPLDAAIPDSSYNAGYLHREFESDPIEWADPIALATQIERWIPLAAGQPRPVDGLVHLMARLPAAQQATVGLPWVDRLVMGGPEAIAGRSYLLPEWLERVRPHATSPELRAAWHRIVDALTVAGDHRTAAMAD